MLDKFITPKANEGGSRLNETHDPALTSWVESANTNDTDFPIQNLPFAVFRRRGSEERFRVGVGIGDYVLDVSAVGAMLAERAHAAAMCCASDSIHPLMNLGAEHWHDLRRALSRLLSANQTQRDHVRTHLLPMAETEFGLPGRVGNYTDYLASMHHLSKVLHIARPEDTELPPNFVWNPVACHGRASTIRPSGQRFLRPRGQIQLDKNAAPLYTTTRQLDYEAELGIYIGQPTTDGQTLSVDEAAELIFGVSVFNDWTARDLMLWELQPLGPFLSKNFATTISPWIVTMEALEPFRCAWSRQDPYPQPLPYLDSARNRDAGGFQVQLQVLLQSEHMAAAGTAPVILCNSSLTDAYWTLSQMVAHHTSSGCSLEIGDLIGTGTISGPELEASGCIFERTLGGRAPVELPSGEKRSFVEDGDTVSIRAFCEAQGYRRIGFGEASSTVIANVTAPVQ